MLRVGYPLTLRVRSRHGQALSWLALALIPLALIHAPVRPATAAPRAAPPSIATITPLLPPDAATGAWTGFALVGTGFGTLSAADLAALQPGDTRFLLLSDVTADWNAGCQGREHVCGDDGVTVFVSAWTDTKIVITQLAGAYGSNGWTLQPGDTIRATVWNPQTDAQATSTTTVVVTAATLVPTGTAAVAAAALRCISVTLPADANAVAFLGQAFTFLQQQPPDFGAAVNYLSALQESPDCRVVVQFLQGQP